MVVLNLVGFLVFLFLKEIVHRLVELLSIVAVLNVVAEGVFFLIYTNSMAIGTL